MTQRPLICLLEPEEPASRVWCHDFFDWVYVRDGQSIHDVLEDRKPDLFVSTTRNLPMHPAKKQMETMCAFGQHLWITRSLNTVQDYEYLALTIPQRHSDNFFVVSQDGMNLSDIHQEHYGVVINPKCFLAMMMSQTKFVPGHFFIDSSVVSTPEITFLLSGVLPDLPLGLSKHYFHMLPPPSVAIVDNAKIKEAIKTNNFIPVENSDRVTLVRWVAKPDVAPETTTFHISSGTVDAVPKQKKGANEMPVARTNGKKYWLKFQFLQPTKKFFF